MEKKKKDKETTSNSENIVVKQASTIDNVVLADDHDYTMEATNAEVDKQGFQEVDDSPVSTPTKSSQIRKWGKPNEDSSLETILTAINTLGSRFDRQERKLGDVESQIKANSTMIYSLATALEFNAAELKECKSRVTELEEKVAVLEEENLVLKERSGEHDRYSRWWNLRLKGIKKGKMRI